MIFYVYLDRFIINPDCCQQNRSSFFFKIDEHLTARELEKISNRYAMLEKLLELDEFLFPADGDPSVYSKIEHFYLKHQNMCCSCTHQYDGEGKNYLCATCIKDEIIKEELIHRGEMWYNTRFKNVYQLEKPLFIRYENMEFEFSLVTQPLKDVR